MISELTMFSLIVDALLLPSPAVVGLNPRGTGSRGVQPHSWAGISGKPLCARPNRGLADLFRQPLEVGPARWTWGLLHQGRSQGPFVLTFDLVLV